ncbi:Transposase [Kocuria rosea]|nr:Transposase [Kocuria rosea]
MPKKYDAEFKARAVRMVREHQQDYPSLTVACQQIGQQLDLGRETLRNWVRQAEIDSGDRDGVTTAEAVEIKRLKAENKRLREANEILRKASIFFAGELDPRNR